MYMARKMKSINNALMSSYPSSIVSPKTPHNEFRTVLINKSMIMIESRKGEQRKNQGGLLGMYDILA